MVIKIVSNVDPPSEDNVAWTTVLFTIEQILVSMEHISSFELKNIHGPLISRPTVIL